MCVNELYVTDYTAKLVICDKQINNIITLFVIA